MSIHDITDLENYRLVVIQMPDVYTLYFGYFIEYSDCESDEKIEVPGGRILRGFAECPLVTWEQFNCYLTVVDVSQGGRYVNDASLSKTLKVFGEEHKEYMLAQMVEFAGKLEESHRSVFWAEIERVKRAGMGLVSKTKKVDVEPTL